MMKYFNVGCNLVNPYLDDGARYSKEAYLEVLDIWRAYDFRYVEFSHVTMLSVEDGRELRQYCREIGLIPWSIHSEHLNDGDTAKHYLAVQTHCAQIADALDARVMVCHLPNQTPVATDMRRDLAILTKLADITHAYQLRLAIETPHIDYIVEAVRLIDRPDVGINIDTGHSYLYDDRDVASVIRKAGDKLFTVHLQDNFGRNDDHQAPGMGNIGWEEVLEALREHYRGPLMVELTGPQVKERRTNENLRGYPLQREMVFAREWLRHLWEPRPWCREDHIEEHFGR